MRPPRKPFPSYKWRWATTTPTESLNYSPVFLGVLRVLRANEGRSPSSPQIKIALKQVEQKARRGLHLTRSRDRNLIRNSGQYWKALGLYVGSKEGIELTPLGRKLADGDITREEFAAVTARTLKLPNRRIETDTTAWDAAGLEITPLELILKIVEALAAKNAKFGYITPKELIRIVIPLAGERRPLSDHVKAISKFREGALKLSRWPNCVPSANDHRMAKEFLLFLGNYRLLEEREIDDERRYYFVQDLHQLLALSLEGTPDDQVPETLRRGGFSFTERARRATSVLARPGQARFRREVLAAYGQKCLLTGQSLEEALEAGHIVPVENDGPDDRGNGICLRADMHALFDAGHIRISPDGSVHLSDAAKAITAYANLPRRIVWPKFVHPSAIEWRHRYY